MPCVARLPPIPMRCFASLQSSLKEGEGDRVGRTKPPRVISSDPRGCGGLAEGQGLLSVLRDGSPAWGTAGSVQARSRGRESQTPFHFHQLDAQSEGTAQRALLRGDLLKPGAFSPSRADKCGTEARNRPVQPCASTAREPANTSGSWVQ